MIITIIFDIIIGAIFFICLRYACDNIIYYIKEDQLSADELYWYFVVMIWIGYICGVVKWTSLL